ncbi:MAG: hypothetical protein FGM14_13610 [Flavobacteriales bacterium]|nr:hypothetical protein [Flavobacteriales bacterium]
MGQLGIAGSIQMNRIKEDFANKLQRFFNASSLNPCPEVFVPDDYNEVEIECDNFGIRIYRDNGNEFLFSGISNLALEETKTILQTFLRFLSKEKLSFLCEISDKTKHYEIHNQ